MYESLKESWLIQEILQEKEAELEARAKEREAELEVRVEAKLKARMEAELKVKEAQVEAEKARMEAELRVKEAQVEAEIARLRAEAYETELRRLQEQREALISYIQARFPTLVVLAGQQAYAIKDTETLRVLLTKLFTAQTQDDATQTLLHWANRKDECE